MPRIAQYKYIAEGFTQDAENLLIEFQEMSTLDFSVFSALWKKHHFSLVFMGKANLTELKEFTDECFLILAEYLSHPSQRPFHIGVIYMMYGLFLKQPVIPKIKIRIMHSQWMVLANIHRAATESRNLQLLYVINRLCLMDAFEKVALSNLMGPQTFTWKKGKRSSAKEVPVVKRPAEELQETGIFQSLSGIHRAYQSLKLLLPQEIRDGTYPLQNADYEPDARALRDLILADDLPRSLDNSSLESTGSESIGSRRAYLRASQFERSPTFSHRRSKSSCSQGSQDLTTSPEHGTESSTFVPTAELPPKKKRTRKRKVKRGRGRPSMKKLKEEEESDSDAMQTDEPPPRPLHKPRAGRTSRKKHYYDDDEDDP